MEFHPDKCQVIPITGNKKVIKNTYTLKDHTLKSVSQAKYLGITLTSYLRWNTHINNITSKGNKTIGFLRRNLNISSTNIKAQAYKSLVRPIVEYGSTVWDPHTQANINQLEMVQRRAARYVCNRHHNTSSVTNMLCTLGWRSLGDRRKDARLCLLFKIVHNLVLVPAPTYLVPFIRSSRLHHNQAFQIPHSNADYHLFSFFPNTIRIWNMVPQNIIDSPNIETFKANIQTLVHIN